MLGEPAQQVILQEIQTANGMISVMILFYARGQHGP